MKADTYTRPGKLEEEVVLYLGSSNSASTTQGNTKHLAQPGKEFTECGRVEIDYNQNAGINRRKTAPYKGPDRVLGRVCTGCLQHVNQ